MDINTSVKILEALANGIDPITGEVLPDSSPYNNADVIRALFSLIDIAKNPPKKVKKVKKLFEEKQSENIDNGLPKNAGLPWSDDERSELISGFNSDLSVVNLAEKHGRTHGAITSELKKQGLIEE